MNTTSKASIRKLLRHTLANTWVKQEEINCFDVFWDCCWVFKEKTILKNSFVHKWNLNLLGSPWRGITGLGICYANNSYMLWLVIFFCSRNSLAHLKVGQISTAEEAFFWVSYLHLKCDASHMYSNAQENSRSWKEIHDTR